MSVAAARLVVLVPAVAALAGLLLARRADRRPARLRRRRRLARHARGRPGQVVAVARLGEVPTVVARIPALDAGELRIPLAAAGDHAPPPSSPLVVAIVGWAVQAFAGWYLRDDDRYGIFAATVSLFTAGMLLVVQSADLVLTLVGWEVMGWCSYLLIGHWSRKESAPAAPRSRPSSSPASRTSASCSGW